MSNKQHLKISFFHDYKSLPIPQKLLNKTAADIAKKEKAIFNNPINVILCSNYKIRKLNAKYRKIDRATDVLSFYFGDDDLLGEIYISLQKAEAQSKQFSISYNEEIKRLFIHGIFHLLGYDHNTKKEEATMKAKEKQFY